MRTFFVAIAARARHGRVFASSALEVSTLDRPEWTKEQERRFLAAHPDATIIDIKSRDITDWVGKAYDAMERHK